ncbi:hypothetical protein OX284_002750 [Flavobacterium sp. SUN046]|uniref:hypothetical protein n=1 Tax=Flavobacterium sp. SUN046 TaxID=3002440 RepID=UPI002DB982A6|nr:hypothetical protein [Flavobacterium sp. SUN046]MEC4048334.1 hypothetical protein [Flavobacterium sp. SUN046]
MKTLFLKTILLFAFFTFFGCSKDSPSSSNNCTPIQCLNGGVSKPDCGCSCPQGFTGANCGTQITPTKITITKIRVTKFPNYRPNNTYWDNLAIDPFTRPDIFPALFDSNANVIYKGSPTIQDAFSYGNDTFDFIPSTPIQITNTTGSFSLYLYDEDSSTAQETMGGFNLNLYTSTTGFPTTIVYGQASDPVGFELTVSYTW